MKEFDCNVDFYSKYKCDDFKSVWSLADAWGNFEISNTIKVNVYEGNLELKSLGIKFCEKISGVKIDGKNIDFKFENGVVYFEKTNVSDSIEIWV